MKLKELTERYGDCEVNEKDILPIIQKCAPSDPLKNTEYFYIDDQGAIRSDIWTNRGKDRARREIGNLFLNEKEAQLTSESLQATQKLIECGGRRRFRFGKANLCLFYDEDKNCLEVKDAPETRIAGAIYFDTFKDAQRALRKVGHKEYERVLLHISE